MNKENTRAMSAAIASQIEEAEAHLKTLKTARTQIELAGMYPSVPTESWEAKNGRGQYLYMLFARGHNGTYAGPNGKRRIYVGSDGAQIADARRLAENRKLFEKMLVDERGLAAYIEARRRELRELHQNASRWPRAELGTRSASPSPSPSGVPK